MKALGKAVGLIVAVLVVGLSQQAFAQENPALWKHKVKGDHETVLADVKRGLEGAQFILTGEENLSKGLENNKHLFPEGKWNTIGFDRVTAVHFCSIVFNQEVFNINMDWSVLCPFKLVVYNMKKSPQDIHIIMVKPTHLLAKDPNKKAKDVGTRIEKRIVEAIKEGTS